MENVSSNGRPVWKHNSRDDRHLFYDKNNFWVVGKDYESNNGHMASKYSREERIPQRSWRRSTGASFLDDSTLIVEGSFLMSYDTQNKDIHPDLKEALHIYCQQLEGCGGGPPVLHL